MITIIFVSIGLLIMGIVLSFISVFAVQCDSQSFIGKNEKEIKNRKSKSNNRGAGVSTLVKADLDAGEAKFTPASIKSSQSDNKNKYINVDAKLRSLLIEDNDHVVLIKNKLKGDLIKASVSEKIPSQKHQKIMYFHGNNIRTEKFQKKINKKPTLTHAVLINSIIIISIIMIIWIFLIIFEL